MKKTAIPAAFLVVGLLVLFGYYRMRSHYEQLLSLEAEQQAQLQKVTSFKMSQNEFTINGKTAIVDFVNADTANFEVRRDNSFTFNNKHLYATFHVAIKEEQPLLLNRDRFDKIRTGMTYSQVGEGLGGSLAKCRLSDNFFGELELVQGKRQVNLSFEDGKVTDKSAKGLD